LIQRSDMAESEEAEFVPSGAIDVTRGEDRAMLRRSIANHWGLTVEDLTRYKGEVDLALQIARKPREKASLLRLAIAIVGQLQAAQEWQAKEDRLDTGQPTENVMTVGIGFDTRG
jgi:hypothetical protein